MFKAKIIDTDVDYVMGTLDNSTTEKIYTFDFKYNISQIILSGANIDETGQIVPVPVEIKINNNPFACFYVSVGTEGGIIEKSPIFQKNSKLTIKLLDYTYNNIYYTIIFEKVDDGAT
jgi:hypothetical protein